MTHKGRKLEDFPQGYFQIIEHFEGAPEQLRIPMTYREAASTRRDFYRFITKLREGLKEGDEYCKKVIDVADGLIISVEPNSYDKPNNPVELVFKLHPLKGGLDAAINRFRTPTPIPTEVNKKEEHQKEDDLIDLTDLDDIMKNLGG